MSRLILDIETAGAELDSLDGTFRDYMLRGAGTEEEIEEVRQSLAFFPQTGQIVAIGLLNPDTDKGAVYYQGAGAEPPFEEEGIRFESGTEAGILRKFWDTVKSYKSIVTYNGRGFDCPYILTRSAVHRIRPTRELMPNRYYDDHIDLYDRLSFYGAVRRKFSLDIWCRTMGIKSPKEEVTGYQVTDLFRQGRHLDIARYCVGDLHATKELLGLWERYMCFRPGG